jgi:glycosyltransferase involved in cell wall biosynthesis
MPDQDIKILIIIPDMRMGGVQTLVLRICKYLYNKGNKAKVLLFSKKGELFNELNNVAEIKRISYFDLFSTLFFSANHFIKDPFFINVNQIVNVYPGGNILGAFLSIKLQIPFKTAVYNPADYLFTTKSEKKLFNQLPDECKLFMNEETKAGTEEHVKKKINGNIWPLAVIDKTGNTDYKNIVSQKNKIISVGNLMSFKTYNMTMLQLIKELKDDGVSLIYEVWGSGPLEAEMKEYIRQNKLTENVFIKGTLPYLSFYEQVKTAYIFVGLGTSAIESSFAGVPTIVATAFTKEPLANGLFTDIEGFNVGEFSPDIKTYAIKDLIKKILSLNTEEYNILSQKHTKMAIEKYDIENVMNKFFQLPDFILESNKKLKRGIKKSFISYIIKNKTLSLKKRTKQMLNKKSTIII